MGILTGLAKRILEKKGYVVQTKLDAHIKYIEAYNLGCSIKEKKYCRNLYEIRAKINKGLIDPSPSEIDYLIDEFERGQNIKEKL